MKNSKYKAFMFNNIGKNLFWVEALVNTSLVAGDSFVRAEILFK